MIKVAIIGGKVHSGGKKNLIMEYYHHIDRSKVQFDWICDEDSNSIPEDEIRELGGRVYRIPPYEHIFQNMRAMLRLFRENKYDVVHAWDSMMNVFPLLLAEKVGIRVRISESLSMADRREKKTFIKYALRPFSKIGINYMMACGKDCGIFQFGRRAYNAGRIAIFKTVINADANAYNSELRAFTRKKFGWEDKVVYGFIGRYMAQKNPLFIIEIFNEIRKRQKNARLVLIGFGDLEEKMTGRIREFGLEASVENMGRREDIKQFYNAFDAFLLPSLYEGLPVVGLESQACGLPVFMSSKITSEAAVCDLVHFIDLKTPASGWAEEIIPAVSANMNARQSHTNEIVAKGYDSCAEATRLMNYYFDAINEQKSKDKNWIKLNRGCNYDSIQ